jgi:hypothetical protein
MGWLTQEMTIEEASNQAANSRTEALKRGAKN